MYIYEYIGTIKANTDLLVPILIINIFMLPLVIVILFIITTKEK